MNERIILFQLIFQHLDYYAQWYDKIYSNGKGQYMLVTSHKEFGITKDEVSLISEKEAIEKINGFKEHAVEYTQDIDDYYDCVWSEYKYNPNSNPTELTEQMY